MKITIIIVMFFTLSGCVKRWVVIDGSKQILLPIQTVNDLYSDNEALLQALIECQNK